MRFKMMRKNIFLNYNEEEKFGESPLNGGRMLERMLLSTRIIDQRILKYGLTSKIVARMFEYSTLILKTSCYLYNHESLDH